MKKEIEYVEKLTWKEMRDSGLLWYVNRLLHLFGRAIVFEYYKTTPRRIKCVYFARCRFRGFSEEDETKGMSAVTNFLKNNIKELQKDIKL